MNNWRARRWSAIAGGAYFLMLSLDADHLWAALGVVLIVCAVSDLVEGREK